MDLKLRSLSDRLKSKIESSPQAVSDLDGMSDLVDAHLELVSAAHGSAHASGHLSATPEVLE